MVSLRAAVVVGILALASCRSPGERGDATSSGGKTDVVDVTLKGVDTSDLTTREKSEWSRYVSEFLAPCPEQPVSIAQCVNEKRPCRACVPAAQFLKRETRKGRVRSQVEASFRARFAPEAVKNIDLSGAPGKGTVSPTVTVAEFADFECPACGGARELLDAMVEKYPNDVRLVFKHFPLSMHPHAEKAARAAVAANKQNKFWELHRLLFENQTALEPENLEKFAAQAGLDMKRFREDWTSEATADLVARDRKQGEGLDISGTPSLFINGRHFPPSPDFAQDLEEWIKLEIELTRGPGTAPAVATAAPPTVPASAAPAAQPPKPSASPTPTPRPQASAGAH